VDKDFEAFKSKVHIDFIISDYRDASFLMPETDPTLPTVAM
jgi:hypothetical protein